MDAVTIPHALLDSLAGARRVVVLTGAGVSAESGIPTFRDAQEGLWAQYKPQDLATPEAFSANPALVWRWYQWRRELCSRAVPNPGHHALADLESLIPEFTLITQNVDGLHQAAGSRNVVEFHGNIHRNRCFREGELVEPVAGDCGEPPLCPGCGAPLRPDVVWFGEAIPQQALRAAVDAASCAEIFIAAGTSAVVYPAAGLAERALAAGAVVVEINPEATALSGRVHHAIAAATGEVLPRLVACLRGELQRK